VHSDGLRPGLGAIGRLFGPAHLGGGDGLALVAELHHVPGGVVGERIIEGGDEAIGIEGERDAGRHNARGELCRPLLESA
jgi:hypothetical protein